MIPNISDAAFRDVDFDSLDPERNVVFILEKVYNYGLWRDYQAVMSYYGEDRIKKEVVKGAYFKKKVFNFLCVIFDLQQADFTCYTRRLSQRPFWEY